MITTYSFTTLHLVGCRGETPIALKGQDKIAQGERSDTLGKYGIPIYPIQNTLKGLNKK